MARKDRDTGDYHYIRIEGLKIVISRSAFFGKLQDLEFQLQTIGQ